MDSAVRSGPGKTHQVLALGPPRGPLTHSIWRDGLDLYGNGIISPPFQAEPLPTRAMGPLDGNVSLSCRGFFRSIFADILMGKCDSNGVAPIQIEYQTLSTLGTLELPPCLNVMASIIAVPTGAHLN